MLPQGGDQPGTDHAGGAPGGEEATVNAADEFGAEEIGEVGGNGRESAAVEREDNHRGDVKASEPNQRGSGALAAGPEGNREIQRDAEEEIHGVNPLAAAEVGEAGPEEAAEHVEDADHEDEGAGEPGRDDAGQRGAKNLGEHGF